MGYLGVMAAGRKPTLRRRPARSGRRVRRRPPPPGKYAAKQLHRHRLGMKRKAGGSATVTKRRRYNKSSGDYHQWERNSMKTGKRIRSSTLQRRVIKSAMEKMVLGFRGIKSFDDNGFYLMDNINMGNDRFLPFYIIPLNAGRVTGASVGCCYRVGVRSAAGVDDGRFWLASQNMVSSDTGLPTTAQLETYYSSKNNGRLGRRSILNYTHVKMNLWGARQKAVRYTVQVVRFTEDKFDPLSVTPGTYVGTEVQQMFESMMKQYTYNPISQLKWEGRNGKMKVLKTFDKTIQPTTSIENDADPQCTVLDWFMRWNRLTFFEDGTSVTSTRIADDNLLVTAAEPTNMNQVTMTDFPKSTSRLYLIVRASDFTDKTTAFSNNLSGSFDLVYRAKWTETAI